MSILIKGMEMPKSCAECRLCEGDTMDGLCHAVSKWFDDEYFRWYQYQEDDIDESKPINCPLIEVTTPHGRLIDVDVAIKQGWTINRRYSASPTENVYEVKALDFLPTIIEAEADE